MIFNPGFALTSENHPMGFTYGACVFGPEVEMRSLDSIRKSLYDPDCDGPDPVYAIAMDVGKVSHKKILEDNHLLYGAVTYAAGKLGKEPVRSQGHIHKNSDMPADGLRRKYMRSGKGKRSSLCRKQPVMTRGVVLPLKLAPAKL